MNAARILPNAESALAALRNKYGERAFYFTRSADFAYMPVPGKPNDEIAMDRYTGIELGLIRKCLPKTVPPEPGRRWYTAKSFIVGSSTGPVWAVHPTRHGSAMFLLDVVLGVFPGTVKASLRGDGRVGAP